MSKKRYGPVYAVGWRPRLKSQRVLAKKRYAPKVKSIGVVQYRARKRRFGYNDNFAAGYKNEAGTGFGTTGIVDQMVRKAGEGGARLLRFPISWCVIAENTNNPEQELPPEDFLNRDPPHEWNWNG